MPAVQEDDRKHCIGTAVGVTGSVGDMTVAECPVVCSSPAVSSCSRSRWSCASASTRSPASSESSSEEDSEDGSAPLALFGLDDQEEEGQDSPVQAAPPLRRRRRRRRSRGPSDARDSDLAYFWRCVQVDLAPWSRGGFSVVGRIATSVHGEVRYVRAADGTAAVAKVVSSESVAKSREKMANERHAWFGDTEMTVVEDPWNEIAVLTYLQRATEQCSFIIRLLGMFQDDSSAYLVTEYCDGGDLFERVAYGDPLAEEEKARYVSQLLHAVQHLHRHNIGHRDISLENVLLRGGDCVLMDFGQAVRLRAMDGLVLRYFAEAGKKMYRAPEMYVPRERSIQVVCPAGAARGGGLVAQVCYDRSRCEVLLPKDAEPGKPCSVEPHGYAAAPVDVFACGVCAFVLAAGKPPWVVARDIDPTFSFIRRNGVPALLRQWRAGLPGVDASPHIEDSFLAATLRVDPTQRVDVDECLRNHWLVAARAST